MKKYILIFDENGILEYVKADIKRCECSNENLQICNCGKRVRCIKCNTIVGDILERNFKGNLKIGITRSGLGINSIIFKNIEK